MKENHSNKKQQIAPTHGAGEGWGGQFSQQKINMNCPSGRKETDCNLLGRKQCRTVVSH